ncbi:MAG: hypothetical protein QOF59_1773 [Actinomycetota bacterium]|nr:hypothetical protein [Actinomycetota bacterium]MDQ1476183.1 hypothetical protein [Actinomycetota bacterium]
MLTTDTKLVSVDDHVIEPPGLFVDHIAPRAQHPDEEARQIGELNARSRYNFW